MTKTPQKEVLISLLLSLGVSLSLGNEIPKEEMPTTFYARKVVVKGFDAKGPVEILPLYKYGYKGSFFLNSRGLGIETERSLLGRGHSLGSHSNSHPVLPDCSYNRIFDELLGSRIAMESRTDVPVSSFSVPGNHFVVDSKPGVEWDIYYLLLRSGYVQMSWPGRPPAGMTELSWNNELPGDCDDPAVLQAAFSKIVNDKEIQQKEPNVSYSTHAWHYDNAKGWSIIE
jgi:peptidoglycan/xylan/chitin deacetylase (PgdA/CDA1 family)